MRRRANPQSGAAGVSLFPFLAVLLCTMGALIVVLVVIARQARLQLAEGESVGAPSPLQQELEGKQADLQWQIDMLQESRSKTREQLDAQRQELSHLEDHSRRLRNQLEELDGARRQFEQRAVGGDEEGERVNRELAEIEAKIADKQKELDEATKKAAGSGKSYAVVPYHGPNETRRRPIYIECCRAGVIFQPEGLVLTEGDFEVSLGPISPMASAVRAAREFLARNQLPGEDGTPYPLLLVRPDGITAYEAAHATLAESRSDFGYELIGQDWPLEFPPTDPRLALAMRQAIGEGRLRQAYLVHAAPQLIHSGPRATFRASPTGGLMRDDGASLGDSRAGSMHGRGGGGRPPSAHGGRYGRYAGSGNGGESAGGRATPSKNLGGNPYRAALASQSQAAAGGAASGAGGDVNRGAGSTGGVGGSGESLIGIGAGDLASGQLNAAPGSPTGAFFQATGGSGPGSGREAGAGKGSSATVATTTNSLAGSDAGARGRKPGALGGTGAGSGAPGMNGKPSGGSGRGSGTGQAGVGATQGGPDGGGRGWGAGQDKVAVAAAQLGAGDELGGSGKGRTGGGSGSGGTGGQQRGGAANDKNAAGGGLNGEDGGPALASAMSGTGDSPASAGDSPGEALANSDRARNANLRSADAGSAAVGGPGGAGDAASGDAGGQPSGGRSAKGSTSDGAGKSGTAAKGGRSGAAGGASGSQSGAGSASSAGNGGGGGGQPQQPGVAGIPGIPNMMLGQQPQSIAHKRGEKNWANPSANRSSFPVTRAIKIICDADHLTLLPEGRSRRGFKVIELGEHSEDGVRQLVTAVWDRIDTWGVAGKGMYWRPELIMEVEPGGERRFNELRALLADSGLDVRGRPRRGPLINYPRTKTPN